MVNCSVRTQPLPKNLVECLSYHLKSPLFPLLLIIIRTIFLSFLLYDVPKNGCVEGQLVFLVLRENYFTQ